MWGLRTDLLTLEGEFGETEIFKFLRLENYTRNLGEKLEPVEARISKFFSRGGLVSQFFSSFLEMRPLLTTGGT